ncbi:MAG TPA: exosortase [Terriglobales bacterium]|jgi:exosortase
MPSFPPAVRADPAGLNPRAAAPGARTAAAVAASGSLSRQRLLFGLGAVAVALAYLPVLAGLASDWATNPNYSHGFVIPFAVAYIVWRQRAQLRRLPVRPSAWGWVLAIVSQVIYLVGYLGAEYFLQRISLLFLIAGGIVLLYGWRHLHSQLFSLALLLIAIPLPALIFNAIAFPLQLLASSWATGLLHAVGIPVFRSGNILVLPHRSLDVAEACSGIRSLFSLIALAMIVAYFVPARAWMRLGLVLTAVPIALAANAFRIGATGVLGQWMGAAASEGFFHAFSGWLIFVVAFAALLGEAALVHRMAERRGGARAAV